MASTHTVAYKSLLARLKAARNKAGLTQTEVARALKRPQSFVSKTESGERRLDPIELLEFAAVYGTTVGFFVAESGSGGASVAAEGRPSFGRRRKRAQSRRTKR